MSETTSDHAVLLHALDFAAAEFGLAIYEGAASAIRALEAKVADEKQALKNMAELWTATIEDRDRLTAEVERRTQQYDALLAGHMGVVEERDRLAAERDRLEGEVDEIAFALPGVAFMDPPDGGSVSIAEQVRRMSAALQSQYAKVASLAAENAALEAKHAESLFYLGACVETLTRAWSDIEPIEQGIDALIAERDHFARENAALRTGAKRVQKFIKTTREIDWVQVVLNGGPPCFHREGGRFCLRAERWEGHPVFHVFEPLHTALARIDAARGAKKEEE